MEKEEKQFRKSQREVFSIVGLPPEVLAVAMAKYSRSVESIKDTIDELTEEKSAQFHEKWVLGYGDASVADMAQVAIALENVSILASKAVEDNRLASYQEKSTRYVHFDLDRFYRPPKIMASDSASTYDKMISLLFSTYESTSAHMQSAYRQKYPKQPGTSELLYETRIKARALDVARYLLPTATLTNFGMIMSARSLRHAISKLKASPVEEFRMIGEEIQNAAVEPAYNPQLKKLTPIFKQLRSLTIDDGISRPEVKEQIEHTVEELQKTIKLQISGAPTLVKRTEPRQYLDEKTKIMQGFRDRLLANVGKPDTSFRVDFINEQVSPEQELVATLLYSSSKYSFRQILQEVRKMSSEQMQEVVDTVQGHRSQYDWPSREFEVGQGFLFDTLMDYGAFRDLQRHRLCTQINQDLAVDHGFEIPRDLEGNQLELFKQAAEAAGSAYREIAQELPHEAAYILPLAYRKRTLFKMNLRELYHIVELRTKPGGHFSYRDVVYDMFEQFRQAHPILAKDMRAVPMDYDRDFFLR